MAWKLVSASVLRSNLKKRCWRQLRRNLPRLKLVKTVSNIRAFGPLGTISWYHGLDRCGRAAGCRLVIQSSWRKFKLTSKSKTGRPVSSVDGYFLLEKFSHGASRRGCARHIAHVEQLQHQTEQRLMLIHGGRAE